MKADRRYVVVVALAVVAVAFGLAGEVAPPLAEETTPTPQQESSPDSVTHFMYPPSFDSGWVNITTKNGQYFTLKHELNSTEVFVDIAGKQSLDPMSGALAWSKAYGWTAADYAYSVVETSDGGYALAGVLWSLGSNFDFFLVKTDSAGNMEWSNNYGGTGSDYASCVVQTSDGGYALAGRTDSFGVGGDFWLVKTDPAGNMEWSNNYGGAGIDSASSVVQTSDGGYALAGYTNSFGMGYDFWLVRTTPGGTVKWSYNYGGAGADYAYSMVETNDGGYALAGETNSYGVGGDCWLVKTGPAGNFQWHHNFGGTGSDVARCVIQTSDGGYALAGGTYSLGVGGDCWLVKTDSGGTMEWSNNYGGANSDCAYSMVETNDGGYALAGVTNSFGVGGDFWLVETGSEGSMQWNRNYGGAGDDVVSCIVLTADGGYALAGYIESLGAEYDFWLVKVNDKMNREHKKYLGGTTITPGWRRKHGGASNDYAYCVVQTSDGGYALAGETNSFGVGGDFWLVKTDPAGNIEWSNNYGGAGYEYATCVIQTRDGGYALGGYTNSLGGGDFWLVKTDSGGNTLWSENYDGGSIELAYCLVQTLDGGYALAGEILSAGAVEDFWLVKTDATGTKQWSNKYGGASTDTAYCLVQTDDGGYSLAGATWSFGDASNFYLVKTDSAGTMQWNKTFGGASYDEAYCVVQTTEGGYALAGFTRSFGVSSSNDFWLVKTDSSGNKEWSKNYGKGGIDVARSMVQTSDGGYALAGFTDAFSITSSDFWLVKTNSHGIMEWSRHYGGSGWDDKAYSVIQTTDGTYALAGRTNSPGAGGYDFYSVKTETEMGLTQTGLTDLTITMYRGKTDLYWNYVRVRIWIIQEPTWMYGDINMDGIVDAKDLYILSRNYGKTFSLLSLSGIVAIAGISTYKKRKHEKN